MSRPGGGPSARQAGLEAQVLERQDGVGGWDFYRDLALNAPHDEPYPIL